MGYKGWFFLALILFVIGLALGLSTPASTTLFSRDIAALEELAKNLTLLPQHSLFTIILMKNVFAVLISFAFSPLFCLVPVLALIFNGWILGIVATTVMEDKSLGYLLAGLLPHGIFELPAFIMGEAVALSFGTTVMLAFFSKGAGNLLLPNLKRSLKYLVVALFLLVPAALIEIYLTPIFLRLLAGSTAP